jgi:hypothetical protein
MSNSLWGIIKGLLVQDETDRSKELSLEVNSASTTGTRVTLKSGIQVANATITLPITTDTLVGKATADVLTNKSFDADGTGNSITNIENADIKAAAGIDASKLADGSVSNTELQYINSVTSNVQTQLNDNVTVISDHLSDAIDAHDASAISNVPSGNLVATDVQSALNEIQSQVDLIVTGGEVNTASNVGSGAGLSFKQKVGVDLEFRSINAGTNVSITNNANDITIATTAETNTASNVGTGAGLVFKQKTGADLELKTIKAGTNLTVTNNTSDITIDGPTFNSLSPMTTGGDLIYGGASGVGTRLPNGANGQILTSSGGTSAPSWTTPSNPNLSVSSKTANYTLTSSDDVILCSGTTFTLTLPTAVGITGKQFIIKHQGSLLADSYTLNTTSSQTINGILSGFYELRTQNETLKIISDGANWQILDHISNTEWVDAGNNTITATTTNPTKGTVNYDYFQWRRSGTNMEFRIGYNQTTAGAAGSGLYLWAIPPGAFADTAFAQDNGASITNLNADNIGFGVVSDNANSQAANTNSAKAFLYNSNNIAIKYEGSSGIDLALNASNTQNFGDTNFSVKITGSIPISGWRP